MASFVSPFAFPFGEDGEDVIPNSGDVWLVNLRPAPEQANVRLLRPITFSIRDFGGFIDPGSVRVAIGYSRIYGRGEKFFDQAIPNTVRQSVITPLTNKEPLLSIAGSPDKYVSLKKVTGNPERSVYFTRVQVDDIRAYRNLMASTLVEPIIVPNEPSTPQAFTGPFFGIEIGPRNTAVYVFFKIINGARKILMTGPYTSAIPLNPQHSAFYDWTTNKRYTISWNESRGLVQLYANNNVLILSVPIDDFPPFAILSSRHVDPNQYAVAYGIEGAANVEARFSSISFTDDVSYPVLTSPIRPNDFNSTFRPADLVRTTQGVDPRKDLVSPWYDDDIHFGIEDAAGAIKQTRTGFQLTRVTVSPQCSIAIFREEPSFLNDSIAGLFVSLKFFATSTQRAGDAAGFGIVIYDGTSLFKIACFQKAGIRYVGIQKDFGDETVLDDDHQFFTEYDWTVPNVLRFIIDGQKDRVRLYSGSNLAVPILDVLLDRAEFPALPFGDPEAGSLDTPYIAVGHCMNTDTAGSMYIQEITYNHNYEVWEGNDGTVPNAVSLGPLIWLIDDAGGPTPPSDPVVEAITINCTGEQTLVYLRPANTDVLRGASVEVKVAIPSSEKLERTGDAVVIDDGVRAFMLTFTETEEGRFACLALRAGLGSFQELVGFDGPGKSLSFRVDWTKPHIYRMERRPFEGVSIYLDNDTIPKIVFPESNLNQIPDSIYSTPTFAFGHFALNAPSSAQWHFIRAFLTTGLEGSFKKNATDLVLKDNLFATESIVLVEAGDTSPVPPDGHFVFTGHLVESIGIGTVEAVQIEMWPVFDFTAMGVTTVTFHLLGTLASLGVGQTLTVNWRRGVLFANPIIATFNLTANGPFHEQVVISGVGVGPNEYLLSYLVSGGTTTNILGLTWLVEIS